MILCGAHEAKSLAARKVPPPGERWCVSTKRGAFPSGASPVVKVFAAIGSASLETSFG